MRGAKFTASLLVLGFIVLAFVANAYTGDTEDEVEDAVSQLNDTINTLQDALDELESYQSLDDEDDDELQDARKAIRNARTAMRSEAIGLLLASVDHRKKGDWEQVQGALKILAPEIFKRKSEN